MPPANIDSKKVRNDEIHVPPDVLEKCLSQFTLFNEFMSKHRPDLSDELTSLKNVLVIQSRIEKFQDSGNMIVACLQNGSAGNLKIQPALVQHFLQDISQLISLLKRLTLSELEVQMRENQQDTELKELIEDAQSNKASHSGDPQSSEETVTTETPVDDDEPNKQEEKTVSEKIEGPMSGFQSVREYISELSKLEFAVFGIISPPLSNEEILVRPKKLTPDLSELDFTHFESYSNEFIKAMNSGHRRGLNFSGITLTSQNRTFDVSLDLIILVSFLRNQKYKDANKIITSFWQNLRRGLSSNGCQSVDRLVGIICDLQNAEPEVPELSELFTQLKALQQFLAQFSKKAINKES